MNIIRENIKIPDYVRGISLVSLMEGNRDLFSNRYIYAQVVRRTVSCRFKDWKYIVPVDMIVDTIGIDYILSEKDEELYNIATDSGEKHNLIDIKPEVAKHRRNRIEIELYKHRD